MYFDPKRCPALKEPFVPSIVYQRSSHQPELLSLAGVTDPVRNASILHFSDGSLRQATGNRNGVDAFCKAADALPLADPTVLGTHHGDHPSKERAIAVKTKSQSGIPRLTHQNCCWYNRRHCPCCSSCAENPRNCRIHHTRIGRKSTEFGIVNVRIKIPRVEILPRGNLP